MVAGQGRELRPDTLVSRVAKARSTVVSKLCDDQNTLGGYVCLRTAATLFSLGVDPPKVYLISSLAALALCGATSAIIAYFALKEPDGHFSLDMLTRWENLHPQPKGETVYLALAMLAVPILLAAIYWIRAARGPVGTQCS